MQYLLTEEEYARLKANSLESVKNALDEYKSRVRMEFATLWRTLRPRLHKLSAADPWAEEDSEQAVKDFIRRTNLI